MKQFYLLFIAVLTYTISFAQPVYPASSYGGAGDSFTFSEAALDSLYINPILTISGPDVNWDFSDLDIVDQSFITIETKEQTDYQQGFLSICVLTTGDFLGCNRLWNEEIDYGIPVAGGLGGNFTDVYVFRKLSNNVLTEAIIGMSLDGNKLGFPYYDIDTVIIFPLEYLNRFSATAAFDLDFSALGAPFAFLHKQERRSNVDSYGSLTTPFATYDNSLRMVTEIVYDDSISINGQTFPIPRVEYIYEWFEASNKAPVLEIRTEVPPLGGPLSISSVRFFDSLRCYTPVPFIGAGMLEQEIVDGEATFNFSNQSRFSDSNSWDFGDGNTSTAPESVSHTYTVPGTYDVTLTACNNICVPPQCEDFVVQVTVIAPVSNSELVVSDFELKYTGGSIIELSFDRPSGYYRLVNSLGQTLIQNEINESIETLNVVDLQSGVYFIQWLSKNNQSVTKTWVKS